MTASTEQLRTASQRLVLTVDALAEHDWTAPSLLPGWTRAHVVAHLALNGEAFAGAVGGVLRGERVPMYVSDQRRDGDIETLATAPPAELRGRLVAAVEAADAALVALGEAPAAVSDTVIDRTPDGDRHFPVSQIGTMRLRELEIHHVDLGSGYSPADWPAEFTETLLASTLERHQGSVDAEVVATDLDRRHRLGAGGPTVSGPAHGLAWWLTGRAPYPGAEVSSDDGALPGIEGM